MGFLSLGIGTLARWSHIAITLNHMPSRSRKPKMPDPNLNFCRPHQTLTEATREDGMPMKVSEIGIEGDNDFIGVVEHKFDGLPLDAKGNPRTERLPELIFFRSSMLGRCGPSDAARNQ
jgi:hypothetical protein